MTDVTNNGWLFYSACDETNNSIKKVTVDSLLNPLPSEYHTEPPITAQHGTAVMMLSPRESIHRTKTNTAL